MATLSAKVGSNGYQELNQINLQTAIDSQFGAGKAVVVDNGDGTFTVSFIDTKKEYDITDNGIKEGVKWNEKMASATQQTINGKKVYAIDSYGNDVDMNYWEYCYDKQTGGYALNDEEVLNNSEYGGSSSTRVRTKGYLGSYTIDGKITVNVPAYIKENSDWQPVTSMYNTFYGCTDLKIAPDIPNTITCMWSTYHNCSNLAEGKVGNRTSDLMNCFMNCSSLTNTPLLPNTAINLNQTFYGCTNLVNIKNIPNSVINLRMTFRGCTKIETSPNIPNSVVNAKGTFYQCTNLLIAPKIGENVETLEETFYQCTNLKEASSIPNSVKIMRSTFNGCTNLVDPPHIIPNNVINLIATFQKCENLEGEIEINSNLTDENCATNDNSLDVGKKSYYNCFNGSSTNGNGLKITTSNDALKTNNYQILKDIINTKSNNSNISLKE